jgi:hypothetical protein
MEIQKVMRRLKEQLAPSDYRKLQRLRVRCWHRERQIPQNSIKG